MTEVTLDRVEATLPAPKRTPLVPVGRHWVKLERERITLLDPKSLAAHGRL